MKKMLVLLIIGFTAGLAFAESIYDGFETYSGALNGENGGIGFGGAWSATSATLIIDGGLSYSNGFVKIDGGEKALSIGDFSDVAFKRDVDMVAGDELYFSFLVRTTVTSGVWFQLYLGAESGTERYHSIGNLNTTTANLGVRAENSNYTVRSGIGMISDETYLLVGRVSRDGSTGDSSQYDLTELWVNPGEEKTLGEPDAVLDHATVMSSILPAIGLRTYQVDGTEGLTIDELRIGDSYEDVVTILDPQVGLYILQ